VTLRPHLRLAPFGFALGAAVSGVGFSDYDELHRMFTLADPRLFLAFAGAVLLAGIAFRVRCPDGVAKGSPVRAGTALGALLFGAGWALCGGCPGAALVQLGEGKLGALLTLGGIAVGTWAGRRVQGALRWDPGSCGG
jgi:uncharacterized membrane protein YedE/YeeE